MSSSTLSRRSLFLGLGAGCLRARESRASELPYEIVDLSLDDDKPLARGCRVLVPRAAPPGPLPVLVLLHGLGETKSERLGVDAWLTPYGLGRAWQRLLDPPIQREREKYLSESELEAFNGTLGAEPFRGLCVVCPYMPNPYRFPGGSAAMFRRYTRWLREALLPAVYARVPSASRAREATGVAGVSLGGFAAIEIALREPALFATAGTLQGAYSSELAAEYARRFGQLEAGAQQPVYVATSSSDPYRRANERLSQRLEELGVPRRFSLRRGPHSQGFLREIGSLELLLWHDRALRGRPELGDTRAV